MYSQTIIILASFNGASFLGEQLDSLIAQTDTNWSLLIRDDGSSDGTLEILQDYSKKDERIHLLPGDIGSVSSARGNFAILLDMAFDQGAEYVFCCDQDDVWAPKKLEQVLARLKQVEGESGLPTLVHHDLVVVNEKLKPLTKSFIRFMKLKPGDQHNPQRLISRNEVTGCALACNRAMLEIALPVSREAIMHDWWLALSAGFFGQLDFMPEKLVKYRQHSKNSIGAKPFWHGLNPVPFGSWVAGWRRGNAEFICTVKQASAFLDSMKDRLQGNPDHLAALELYSRLPDATRSQRLHTLRQCGLWRSHWFLNVIIVMRVLLLPKRAVE